ETIRMSYFAQEVPDMSGNERVIDYIRDVAEFIQTKDGKISASMMLERFLFDPAMQYTPLSKLSGGEKRRLYLLKTLMEAPNVLLLDEPSNDLDIPTLTILEDYLQSFVGIVVAVSHDRYFLDNVADRIFAFEEGEMVPYEGGYTDYREKLKAAQGDDGDWNGKSEAKNEPKTENKSSGKNWKADQKQKLKFSYKEQREFETIDEDIAKLEDRIASLEQDMQTFATNSLRLQEIVKEKEEAEAHLEEKMDRWVYLNDLAEQIEKQKDK
ncbi:MAG: ATP-binding cassette domain-containing protein, partial [Eubacteriales bacterium]|nr:ATP-binding cassette domain-containing protein [Eubacteriales bacterium]